VGNWAAAGVFFTTLRSKGLMDHVGPELLARLVDEHGARLVLYAQQWCTAPEDVVQDAFVQLVRQRPAPADMAAWLYRTVRNGAISAARSSTRRLRHETSAAQARTGWFAAVEVEELDSAAAVEALLALPMELRETLVLRLWSDLSFDEIASLTQASTSTAHRRYSQALAALRARLGVPRPK
jgi:RNA polymerase sigma factor (sigma-70 family)